jgi:hypothetical protein
MRRYLLRQLHRITLASIVAAWAAGPAAAEEPDLSARVARLKETQVRFMLRGAQGRAIRYAGRQEALKAASLKAKGGAIAGAAKVTTVGRARRPARQEPGEPQRATPFGVQHAQAPLGVTAIAPNRRVNDPATDTATCPSAPCAGLPWSGQCEVSIVAHGSNVVAAWNDGEGFVSGLSTQGYAYSNDGGVTWVDGGIPPVTNVGEWTSDPVLAVNEKTGEFYFSALCDPTVSTNGIGVVKGTFIGGVLTWQTPEVAISGNNTAVVYDKQWIAADSTTGNVYLVYSRFTVSGGVITTNRIDFQRKTNPLLPFGAALTISSAADAGRAQGARVFVGPGPGAEVWTTWNAIGTGALDHMRVRRSVTQGTSFQAEVTAVDQYTNFGTGAPGFNRGLGFAFPGLAIDRSTGPRRGRAYLTWNESVNFFNDDIGNTGNVPESEPNDAIGGADAFTQGNLLSGAISSVSDFDYWSFNGTAGQTIICEYDGAAAPTLDASFRLFCSDGVTRLGYSESGPGGTGLIVFTLPANGLYYLRVAPFSGTGSYSIATGLNGAVTERARDHRDVFTCYSDNYTTWSTPARVNGDLGRLDNWLPEIAVATTGDVYVSWYDWRDAPGASCAGASMTYLARSTDGAASWADGSPVTDALSTWTTAYSNIAPNQGDYIGLYANQTAVYACWSDGRNGHPDVYMAAVPLAFTPVMVALASAHAEPGLVRLVWYAPDDAALTATVYRRTDAGEWAALGLVSPDGAGRMVFEDREVAAATRYHYRLGVLEDTGETFTGEVTVEVPAGVALSIDHVHPNPSDRQMWVTFSLPGDEPATLELMDVSGRRVRAHTVSGAGRHTVDLATGSRLAPGVYLMRLTQAGRVAVKRVSVIR